MKGYLSNFWSGFGKILLLKFWTYSFFLGSIWARFDPSHALDISRYFLLLECTRTWPNARKKRRNIWENLWSLWRVKFCSNWLKKKTVYVEFQKEWLSKAGSKIREMTLHLKEPTQPGQIWRRFLVIIITGNSSTFLQYLLACWKSRWYCY